VPYTTLHVGRIEGGTALNIVPGKCTVDFEIRNIAQDNGAAILDRLATGAKRIAKERRPAFPEADIRVDVVNEYPGLTTPLDSDVVRFAGRIVDHPDPFKRRVRDRGREFLRISAPSEPKLESFLSKVL
jgi:acetylornithine deacetylase